MSLAKNNLHDLIDKLPDTEAESARRFLEFLIAQADKVYIQALREMPMDDEPLTDEDLNAIKEGREDIKAGRIQTLSEVMQELGL